MASTYSPALRLELMATGDQSGTWGDTTNTNLGTLLEQAITGVLSVAQGDVANLTLTTVNGGSDQARNAVVRITGALTATRNVVVQTANKLYTIANDTTGGFSIVVKTTAGTGVSIPPGAMIDVYSNGTNVITGANYWSGQIGGAVWLDAGATVGPVMDLFRDSASPAASDILGQVIFNGRDSAGNKQEYAAIQTSVIDPVSTTEDGSLDLYAAVAGTRTLIGSFGPNVMLPSGRTIDWAAGDVVITHSTNTLAFTGAANGYSFDTYVLRPNSPFFFATRGTADTGPITVANYSEISDTGANFNPTSGTFTAPIAGRYHFDAQLINQNAVASLEAEIRVNGSTASIINFAPLGQMCVILNANLVLAANDAVTVFITGGTTQAAAAYNRFGGFMVG